MTTYSQLMYRDVPPAVEPEVMTVVALHGDRGGLNDLIPFARSLGPAIHIVAPEAARGVYQALEIVSRTWFGGTLDAPEPASFGDSLAQLEKFLYDVRYRSQRTTGEYPLLVGFDQGAVLAAMAALVLPDLIGGVVAIDGGVPTFRLWSPPEVQVHGLPVLFVSDPADTKLRPETLPMSVERLRARGADVAQVDVPGARALGPAVTEAVRAWLAQHEQFAPAVSAPSSAV